LSNINWNEAPEGTTHADCEGHFYLIELTDNTRVESFWDDEVEDWLATELTTEELFELIPARGNLWYDNDKPIMYPCKGERFLWKNKIVTALAVTSEEDLVFEVEGKVKTLKEDALGNIQPLPSPTQLAEEAEKKRNKELYDLITKRVVSGKRDRGLTPEQVFENLYSEGYRICKVEQ
jgi:hypothetical protein